MNRKLFVPILCLGILFVSMLQAQVPEMIEVPSGNFVMGADSLGFAEHEVSLTHNFEMSKYEITSAEFCTMLNFALNENELQIIPDESVLNLNGDQQELLDLDSGQCQINFEINSFVVTTGMEQFPVVEITWFGAAFYCNMLSRMNGNYELYDLENWSCEPYSESGFRLPTEAEWEYAARYNDGRIYPWGNEQPDSTRVNCFGMGIPGLVNVGSFSPNGDSTLGFCDLSGNVWEWCNDWFEEYSSDPQVDPIGPETGTRIMIRGAGWMSLIEQLHTANRFSNYKDHSYYDFGFRLVYFPEQTLVEPELETNQLKCIVYPNPFNPSTTISFSLTAADEEDVEVEIYNLKGQKVKKLVSDQLSVGQHSIIWNGTNHLGNPVSSGVYFYKIRIGNVQTQGKLLLLK
ncbi:SUMF1/EgtB/PvdO family nonheme iron enzyme [Candidatus Cloacimonadota bacterium]